MVNKNKFINNIFNLYYQHLCFYAGKYITDIDNVKDIVQEVFVNIWEKKLHFENENALKSYLFVTVRNSCINFLKSAKIHDKHHNRILRESTEEVNDNYITDRIEDEVMWELLTTIESLPEACRKIFKLSYLEGKNINEVAEILDISTHTVKSQRARAKQLLQERLKDLFPLLVYFFIR